MQKCYNILITGNVQDIGFRALIEDIARFNNLKGFVFNDPDGSIKMVCCGDNGIITDFLDDIKFKGVHRGAIIDEVKSEEMPFDIYLPQKFIRLYTDELTDIARKLDKGNELLGDIKSDTSALPEIKTVLDSYIGEQKEHNQWMKEHLIKMDEHNQWIKEHNQNLEKILEKLVEK